MLTPALVTAVHVVAGTLVLGVGPAAMVARKGGAWHRRIGVAFLGGMAIVLATAAFMWQPYGHVFLLFLDVVCAYLLFAGVRTIARRRRRTPAARHDALDLGAAILVLASAVALVAIALTARTELMRTLALVIVALAGVAFAFAALEVASIRGTRTRRGSLLMHLSAMIGAYISAVTAFAVINVHAAPMTLRWLVPSLAGSAVIAAFSIAVRRRFAITKREAR